MSPVGSPPSPAPGISDWSGVSPAPSICTASGGAGRVERRRVVGIVRSRDRRAARTDLGVGVLVEPQRGDELGDARVVRAVHLELVTPRLHRDSLVESRVRRHQRVLLPVDLRGECVDPGLVHQVRVVRDPDRAVLERVHRVLRPNRVRIDDAGAGRPDGVVRATKGRRLVVGHPLRRLHVQRRRVVDLDDAVDGERRILVGLARRVLLRLGPRLVLRDQVPRDEPDQADDHHHRADGQPRDLALGPDALAGRAGGLLLSGGRLDRLGRLRARTVGGAPVRTGRHLCRLLFPSGTFVRGHCTRSRGFPLYGPMLCES